MSFGRIVAVSLVGTILCGAGTAAAQAQAPRFAYVANAGNGVMSNSAVSGLQRRCHLRYGNPG